MQLIVIFRKKHKILNFLSISTDSLFPSVFSVFYASFTACSMYVQCTFTVSLLRAHGTCRKKYEVCEGRRGKRNRLYFEFRLCRFVFATFAERALCSGYCLGKAFLFVFGPQATFTSNTPTHCTRPCFTRLRKGISMQGIGQVSPECQGMLCVWRAWDRLGLRYGLL